MSRTTIFFILVLLFCSPPPYTASLTTTTTMTKHKNKGGVETAQIEEGCEGIGEEECLMRRTLVAHIDYIYTQNQTP
ncbi:phytosulfokines 3 [Lactuca sativa]|uniref:phytosulfokines 3 n=1 Tax=Lactuca sativa TaxID=4236 RepID=UPI000CCAD12E|nr:phytosulfokines 3 [Lactuca sativa]